MREDGDSYKIYVNKELLMRGYFELKHTDIISGELLIFYSYLRDKGSQHDYIIDTYKSKMHEEIGNSEVSITKLLNRLYEVGLAERVKGNNKLIIR